MLLVAAIGFAGALLLVALNAWPGMPHGAYVGISATGLLLSACLAMRAWSSARAHPLQTQCALFLAYCVLLAGPASQLYVQINGWQDLSKISRAMQLDAGNGPLILLSPDETTLAVVDLYAPSTALPRAAPRVAADAQVARQMAGSEGVILVQLPKPPLAVLQRFRKAPPSGIDAPPPWIAAANLEVWKTYSVPNGRRYALLRNSR
jgi:hypothetical protein